MMAMFVLNVFVLNVFICWDSYNHTFKWILVILQPESVENALCSCDRENLLVEAILLYANIIKPTLTWFEV
jgi:putative effector of murein hydrolase